MTITVNPGTMAETTRNPELLVFQQQETLRIVRRTDDELIAQLSDGRLARLFLPEAN